MDQQSELSLAREEGEARGEARGKLETAKNLKACGVDAAIIKKATGLSEEEIEKL